MRTDRTSAARQLARYFPSMSPEFLVGFGGWSGRGRQEAVEPLFSPTVTPSPDGRSFDISQPVNVVTYRRGPGGRNWRLSGFDTPSLSFTIHVEEDRLHIARPPRPPRADDNRAGRASAGAAAGAARGDTAAGGRGWAARLAPARRPRQTAHRHEGPGPDEPAPTVLHSYAVRGTVRSAP